MRQLIETVRTRSPGTFFGGYNGIGGLPSGLDFGTELQRSRSQLRASSTPAPSTTTASTAPSAATARSTRRFRPSTSVNASKPPMCALDWGTEIAGLPLDGNLGLRYARTNVTSAGLFSDRIREESSPGQHQLHRPRARQQHRRHRQQLQRPAAQPERHAADDGRQPAAARRLCQGDGAPGAEPAGSQRHLRSRTAATRSFTGGDGTDDCTAGNPDLKPYRATKYDLSLEFYPSRDTQVSAALFRTDIDTYVREGIRRAGVDFFGDGRLFDVTQPINGQGAQTTGVEIAGRTALTFLPGWMKRFRRGREHTRA